MPKYGNFENRPVSQKRLPVERLGYRESTYATLGPFFKFYISGPSMEILKIGPYLEKKLPVE